MLNRINQDNWINPIGYCNRIDTTNLNERYLTAGSQNVMIENIDDQSTRVMTRWGFTKCFTHENLTQGRFLNAWRWDSNNQDTLYFTAYLNPNPSPNASFDIRVTKNSPCGPYNDPTPAFGLPAGLYSDFNNNGKQVRFTSWYDPISLKDVAIIAYGSSSGFSTFINNTTGPIANLSTIKNNTGGAGNAVFPPNWTFDYIATYRNQVYYGSRNSRVVYVSSCKNYLDLTYTTYQSAQQAVDGNGNTFIVPATGRQSCEGAEILLDSSCRGFGLQNGNLNIFTDKHHIYEVEIAQGQFANTEELRVKRLKTSSGQGAMSQELITEIKNGIVYVSKEKTVDILSEIENFSSIQAKPINDIVMTDFDNFDYEDAKIFYHKRNIYFTFPKNSVVMIYNLERGMWQPPQIMAIGGFISVEDDIYGFEYIIDGTAEVYYMDCFNNLNKNRNDLSKNDDGAGFTARIVTPYTHLGVRNHQKFHNSIFVEGYINSVSEIKVSCLYDYGGFSKIASKIIYGQAQPKDKLEFIKQPVDTLSIGKSGLGNNNLSNKEAYIIPKFHRVVTFPDKPDYYERQIQLEGDVYDQRWGIIAYSTNASLSTATNQAITN